MHNMMVEDHIRSSDRESEKFYEVGDIDSTDNAPIESTSDVVISQFVVKKF